MFVFTVIVVAKFSFEEGTSKYTVRSISIKDVEERQDHHFPYKMSRV